MRTGIIADIHANALALDAVLEDGRRAEVDQWVALGDVVGYGPEPGACLQRLRDLGVPCVMGNHEARVLDLPTAPFNVLAEEAILYTRSVLSPEDLAQLRAFTGPIRWDDRVLFCHGSPADRDEYLLLRTQFEAVVQTAAARLVFCGHTHIQFAFDGRQRIEAPGDVEFQDGQHMLVNPGSVGQPRDGDPRAAYAILDAESNRLRLRRVEYDVRAQRDRVVSSGLPRHLGERLLVGH